MIATILAALVKFGPLVLGALGIFFGLFRHQQAKIASAEADKKGANADARVSAMEAAMAKANEQAAQAGAEAAKERTDVENSIAAAQSGDSQRVLRNLWSRD